MGMPSAFIARQYAMPMQVHALPRWGVHIPALRYRSQDRATDMAAFVRDLSLVAEKLGELRAAG